MDGGGDKTTATNPAIYVSRYGTLTLEDGAVLRNCKSQYYAGGAVGLFAGTSEFVMNGTAAWRITRPITAAVCMWRIYWLPSP